MRLVIGEDTISIGISLPKEIITKIDAERGDVPRSRFLLRVLQKMYVDKSEKHVPSRLTQDSFDRRIAGLQSSESKTSKESRS
jgi:hypothetical protein